MVTLATELSRGGFCVSLVLSKAEGPYLSVVPSDVQIVDLGCARVLWSLPRLAGYLRRERPSVVISAMTHANVTALWARRIARVSTRVIVTERNTLSRTSRSPPMIRQRLMPYFAKCLYPWADEIVAVSHGVADDLADVARVPRGRIAVIYNPIVSDSLLERAKLPPDHPWFEAGGAPVILGVGRLVPAKDFETLIKAFAKTRPAHGANLVILGEGPERGRLQRLVATLSLGAHVSMPGFVENPLSYMSRAAVFVLSSAYEGLPAVLVEAMACGTPVVSTDCPSGPAEILENGAYGPLVPVGNSDALAVAITTTLARKPSADRLRYRASTFGVRASVDGYMRFLTGSSKHWPGPNYEVR